MRREEKRVGKFEEHGTGYKADIDIRVGPAYPAWNCRAFAATLRADVERVLGISFPVTDDGRDPTGGYRFWFENDEMSVHVIVDDPEEGWPLDKVPAAALPISRSEQVATWELAEKLYDGLNALDTYLLIALDQFGMPVAANFDIGDGW
ncbi:hypothetical protein [Streptomyces nigra]